MGRSNWLTNNAESKYQDSQKRCHCTNWSTDSPASSAIPLQVKQFRCKSDDSAVSESSGRSQLIPLQVR